ncbi:dihydroxy-acid dehydratase, partial [Thioclava sp. BHET1]
LALLRNGDIVRLDLEARRLDMLVSDEEIAARRAAWIAPAPRFGRGWGVMFSKHVTQADEGCDFDFLQTSYGPNPGEPDIF